MRAEFEHQHERDLFAARLGLSPSCNDETLAEAAAEFFDGGRDWLDADDRPVPTEYDDHFGESNHRRLAAGARARRSDAPPAPTYGQVNYGGREIQSGTRRRRVHFSGSGQSVGG